MSFSSLDTKDEWNPPKPNRTKLPTSDEKNELDNDTVPLFGDTFAEYRRS